MAFLAYSPASPLPACKDFKCKSGWILGISFSPWGWDRALCLVTDLWKFLVFFFPVQ